MIVAADTEPNREFEGRTALITGATRGIGLEVAHSLVLAGAKVAICGRNAAEGEEALRLLESDRVTFMCCDVSDPSAVKRLIQWVVEQSGAIDIVVNNAGIARDSLLLRTTDAAWDQTLSTNLTGAFYVCRAAAKYLLKAREAGRIVNISSVVGEQGNAGQAAYAASKAGLLGLTRALAREFAGRGVTVNAISPGFIETSMTEEHVNGPKREHLLAQIPLARVGCPADVAAAVKFLCSSEAGYITGEVLRVNGGLYM